MADTLLRALKKDPTRNEEEALKEIYKRLRPGEPPTTANAKALLHSRAITQEDYATLKAKALA